MPETVAALPSLPHIILGIGSFSYPWAIGVPEQPRLPHPMDSFALLEAAILLGVQRVQYVDNLPLNALPRSERDRLASRARDIGVVVEIGMRGTDKTGLREHLVLAREFGSPFVRVMPDKGEEKPAPREIVSRLRPLLPEFADAGVLLALENHERIPVRQLREVVAELGTQTVRVCLDTTNSWGGMESPEYVMETLADLTCNLHLKDFVVKRVPSLLGFLVHGTPAGTGALDIPHLLNRLPSDCSVTLEQWTPFQADIEATCRMEAEWATQSIAYLQEVTQQRAA